MFGKAVDVKMTVDYNGDSKTRVDGPLYGRKDAENFLNIAKTKRAWGYVGDPDDKPFVHIDWQESPKKQQYYNHLKFVMRSAQDYPVKL